MAKQNRTIVALASRIVANVNARIAADVDMKTLVEECSTLALADRAKIDAELVNYYAVQAGVGVKERTKLSLIHISEPTRPRFGSRMPSSA